MMKLKKYLVLIFMLFTVIHVFSQKTDSTAFARNKTTYFYDKPNSFDLPYLIKVDTIIKGFQQYNPSFNNKHFTEWSGNVGRPSKSMIYEPIHKTGFDYGVHTFDDLLFSNYSQPYYQVLKPYTSIFYMSGPEKEDILQVIHSQNITNNLNVGLNFRVIDSWGSYQWQTCDNRQLLLNTNYISPFGKYRIMAAYYHNSIEIQENGGISNDSIFENHISSQTLSLPVNLQSANNQWKETSFFIKQFYNFKKIKNDSSIRKTFNPGTISHSFQYFTQNQTYKDNNRDSKYYSNIYFDSISTHDSIYLRSFENNFSWTNGISENPLSPDAFNLIFGLKQKYIEIKDSVKNFSFNQLTPYAALSVFAFGKFHLNLNAEYIIGDYNGGDLSLKGVAKFDFVKHNPGKKTLTAGIYYTQKQADWIYAWCYSNYFRWNNDFKKQNFLTSFLDYQSANFNITLTLHQINNYIYLNDNSLPDWHDEMIHILSAKLSKNINWGILQIDNDIVYQYTTNKNIIKIPEISAMQSWYFNLHLFKKAMYLQPGFSFFYNTSYFSDNYMPALRMFYNQNNKITGNYLYADIFVNLQIKRANVFLKYQHINSGWDGYRFYLIPHYPQQAGALKLGIIWRFYD